MRFEAQGARLCRSQGIPEHAIQALMTHANKRTTQIYLERGKEALTNEDYLTVSAPPLCARATESLRRGLTLLPICCDARAALRPERR